MRNASRNSKGSEISINRKEVIWMADKKQSTCGCGCLPPPGKKPKSAKPEAEKSKKSKK